MYFFQLTSFDGVAYEKKLHLIPSRVKKQLGSVSESGIRFLAVSGFTEYGSETLPPPPPPFSA